jgi:hypothetical protein
MSGEIVNKVASSSLVQLDLEEYYPKEPVTVFDLQPYLFMGMILKEKDFRDALQGADWKSFEGKVVAVTCTADAIIPAWAYMLVASYLQPFASDIIFGTDKDAVKELLTRSIRSLDAEQFRDRRVVVKGCGDLDIEAFAYLEVTKKLRPVAKSIMYGEPCSTVPVFKRETANGKRETM